MRVNHGEEATPLVVGDVREACEDDTRVGVWVEIGSGREFALGCAGTRGIVDEDVR